MGDFGLRVVVTRVHDLRLDVLQDVDDLLGELHLVDARDAGHGGQGLTVPGQGQVGLEHEGRGQTQRFQGSESLQFSAWKWENFIFSICKASLNLNVVLK